MKNNNINNVNTFKGSFEFQRGAFLDYLKDLGYKVTSNNNDELELNNFNLSLDTITFDKTCEIVLLNRHTFLSPEIIECLYFQLVEMGWYN